MEKVDVQGGESAVQERIVCADVRQICKCKASARSETG